MGGFDLEPNTQKLSIRLLREGLTPEDALRSKTQLIDWPKVNSGKIVLDTIGGKAPKWAPFLELAPGESARLQNASAYGLVFTQANGRWFAVSFGMGHVKLDPSAFEPDFGLRVVLNSVDPHQLKSADIRTPDENTLSRRSQTSRGSDQTAFAIDVERDIVRGLAGTPKSPAFAVRVAGTDSLSLDRKMVVADLTKVCSEAYLMYQKTDYKNEFGWIDQIRHVRDDGLIRRLDAQLTAALDAGVRTGNIDGLHLAFPIIYDPESTSQIRYKGFRSQALYGDLDITGYIDALREQGVAGYSEDDLKRHSVHQVDDAGNDCGSAWKIRECLVYETSLNENSYVLSGGLWYQIDIDLAKEVKEFFDAAPRYSMPHGMVNENEQQYNSRLAQRGGALLCLDTKLVTPTGATTRVEPCDFLSLQRHLIHVKDKTSSSRLSHLFNQGTVSGRLMIVDPGFRERLRDRIREVENQLMQKGYADLIPKSGEDFKSTEFTVVYAVLATGKERRLPFFSLVSFRQAARELQALGYKYAFAWIEKRPAPTTKTKRRSNS